MKKIIPPIRNFITNPNSIIYFEDYTLQEKIIAIRGNPNLIQYLDLEDYELTYEDIKLLPRAIEYISNPSEQLKLDLVKNNPFSIHHIQNPSEELQLLALKLNKNSHQFIHNQLTEKSALELVSNDGLLYQYCYSPYQSVKKAAIQNNPFSIKYIWMPNEELQLLAINLNIKTMNHIRHPTELVKERFNLLIKNKLENEKESLIKLEKSLFLIENRYNKDFLNNILDKKFIEESPIGIFTKEMILNNLKKKETTFNFLDSDLNIYLDQNFVTIEYSIQKIKPNNTYLSKRKSIWLYNEDGYYTLYRHHILE